MRADPTIETRTPLLLGLFRGTYCPFCRRAIIRMGQGWERLRGENVEASAVVATASESAQLYFRLRPPRLPVAADPDFITHRLYGEPRPSRADIQEAFRTTRINPSGELPAALPVPEASVPRPVPKLPKKRATRAFKPRKPLPEELAYDAIAHEEEA